MISTLEQAPVPTASNSGGPNSPANAGHNTEDGAPSQQFGDVLGSQKSATKSAENNAAPENEVETQGGKPLHTSGKELPVEQPVGESAQLDHEADNLNIGQHSLPVGEQVPSETITKVFDFTVPETPIATEEIDASKATDQLIGDLAETAEIDVAQEVVAAPSELASFQNNGKIQPEIARQNNVKTGSREFAANILSELPVTTPSKTTETLDLQQLRMDIVQQFRTVQQALAGGQSVAGTEADGVMEFGQPKASTTALSQANFSSPLVAATGAVTELSSASGLKLSSSDVLGTHLTDANWRNDFSNRMTVFVKQGVQEASLQLTPQDLGKLDVKISIEGDQAKLFFGVQNAVARDALEQAIPRLREALEQGGLQLAHSEVADQSQSQQQGQEFVDNAELNFANTADGSDSSDIGAQELTITTSDKLVDYYI